MSLRRRPTFAWRRHYDMQIFNLKITCSLPMSAQPTSWSITNRRPTSALHRLAGGVVCLDRDRSILTVCRCTERALLAKCQDLRHAVTKLCKLYISCRTDHAWSILIGRAKVAWYWLPYAIPTAAYVSSTLDSVLLASRQGVFSTQHLKVRNSINRGSWVNTSANEN